MTVKPVIGTIIPNSIAAQAGLLPNQEIISLDNKPTPSWTTIFFRFMTHFGNKDHIQIETTNLMDKKINSYRLNLTHWHMNDLNPDPLISLGITPYEPTIPLTIGTIIPMSPAAKSSLKINDKLLALNQVKVKDWQEIMTLIDKHPDVLMTITVERQGKILQIPVHIGYQRNILFQKQGILGISPTFHWPKKLLHKIQYGPVPAILQAWQEVMDLTWFNLILFGKMFTGKLSLQSLGGPITIFETAGEAFNSGLVAFMSFLAFLSISIGVINLLPIPGLDGGHLLIQVIESVIRRPLPSHYVLLLFRLGFIFIFFVLIRALMNDILRLY
jgi:regulator of sigma E protease